MSDSAFLQRHSARVIDALTQRDPGLETDACDDLDSFGWLRGIRDRAVMLELRKKNGNILALGYGWMERVEFDPSEGITLHVVGQKIRLRGRNLNTEVRPLVRLFEGIVRHRIAWVREASHVDSIASQEGACVIESIEW